jgi:DNA-binding ferritin-like protein (Dps family)
VSVLGPLLDLFEQGAANGTTVREIVAKGPVELAELFVRNYSESQ